MSSEQIPGYRTPGVKISFPVDLVKLDKLRQWVESDPRGGTYATEMSSILHDLFDHFGHQMWQWPQKARLTFTTPKASAEQAQPFHDGSAEVKAAIAALPRPTPASSTAELSTADKLALLICEAPETEAIETDVAHGTIKMLYLKLTSGLKLLVVVHEESCVVFDGIRMKGVVLSAPVAALARAKWETLRGK